MSKEELLELDGLVLTDEEFHNLEEEELVDNIDCDGTSGLHPGCLLWSVTLEDGEEISVYTRSLD
jgi:hypothetical protein